MSFEERIIDLSDCRAALEAFGSEAEAREPADHATPPPASPDPPTATPPLSAVPIPEPAAPAQQAIAERMSLADVDAAGVRTEWYEAIAIAGALCGTILDSGDEIGPARIDPQRVFISAAGDVTTTANGSRNAPAAVGSIGKILDTLLPQQDVMFLRPRLVSKATSTPPHYNTLVELSQAIAYYERPNRAQIVQGLYRRCHKLPPLQQPAPPPPPAPAAIPAPEDEPPAEETSHRAPLLGNTRSLLLLAAACMMFSALGAGAILFLRHPSTEPAGPGAIDAVEQGAAAEDHSPSPPSAPSTSPALPSPAARSWPVQKAPASSIGTPAAVNQTASPYTHADDAEARAKYMDDVRAALNEKIASLTPGVAQPAAIGRPLIGEAPAAGAIFTVRDSDVVPPAVLYPRFLTAADSEKRRNDLFLVEIVVNERGEVEGVKGRNSPRSIGDSLFLANVLSAAKSWRFTPAVKGNYRVKYRYLVELARY